MAKQKLEQIAPFGLRLQSDLKAKLEDAARQVPRSLNAEIAERLQDSFLVKKSLAEYSDGELLDEVIKRWGRENIKLTIERSG